MDAELAVYLSVYLYTEQGFYTLFYIFVSFQVLRGHFEINFFNSLGFSAYFSIMTPPPQFLSTAKPEDNKLGSVYVCMRPSVCVFVHALPAE